MTSQFCVFGGAIVDCIGTVESPFFIGQSHPGHWEQTIGGVGANIARHLAHFGGKVQFASVFGDDDQASLIKSRLDADGLILLPDSTVPNGKTPSYTAIHDQSGDVIVGLADMALHAHMDDNWTKRAAHFAISADVWVADTNMSEASLSALCELKRNTPLIIVAVSPAKVSVLERLTGKIDGLICNRSEAEALLKKPQHNAAQAATALVSLGIPLVIVSDGSAPCALAKRGAKAGSVEIEEQTTTEIDPKSASVRLTGVGDTFAAACLFALSCRPQTNPTSALKYANAAASLAMAETDTCPKISWQAVEDFASESKTQ